MGTKGDVPGGHDGELTPEQEREYQAAQREAIDARLAEMPEGDVPTDDELREMRDNEWAEPGRLDIARKTWGELFMPEYGLGALSRAAALTAIAERQEAWLVDGLVAEGTHGVLAGAKGIGKTWALLDLAVSVALGTDWLGRFACEQRRALVLTCEDSWPDLWRRADAIAVSRGHDPADLDGWLFIHPEPVRMNDRAQLNKLAEELDRVGSGLGLVVLDPAYKYFAGADPSNLLAMGEALAPVQSVCNAAGTALVVGHHFNRKTDARGGYRLSGAGFLEWGRVIVTMDGPEPVPGARTRDITVEVSGNSIADTAVRVRRTLFRDGDDPAAPYVYAIELLAEGAAASEDGPSTDARLVAVLAAERGRRMDRDAIVEAFNADGGQTMVPKTIANALRSLVKRGSVQTSVQAGKPGGQWWVPEKQTMGETGVAP